MRSLAHVAVMAWVSIAILWPQEGLAATNNAVDPGGGSVTLAPSGPVTVNAVTLSLVQQARDLTGSTLPEGANVLSGQEIYFVLFVDNTTPAVATGMRLIDRMDESQFTYVQNTLETTEVSSGSDDATLWGGVWTPLTDAIGSPDDIASVINTGGPDGLDQITVGDDPGQENKGINISGNTKRALRFKVTIK